MEEKKHEKKQTKIIQNGKEMLVDDYYVPLDVNAFKDIFKTEPNSVEALHEYKKYLREKILLYKDAFQGHNLPEIKEYINYLVAAFFIKCKDYYPTLSIYIPFRTKSAMSFNRNIDKETTNQFIRTEDLLLDDDKVISDLSAITIVLDHINPTININENYNYNDNPETSKLLEESRTIIHTVGNIESQISGFLTRVEYLNYKKQVLELILKLDFPEFTNVRTPSYESELVQVQKVIESLKESEADISYASDSEIQSLKILLTDLKSKLYDKAYHTMLPEVFETVMSDDVITKGFRTETVFIKDVKKDNGFAANYYLIKSPFGNFEVQLQSGKRYYEAKKGTASHSSIPGKQLDVKEFFELVDPNDQYPLKSYLSLLERTPSSKIITEPYFGNKRSNEYKESLKLQELLKHIKLKDSITDENGIVSPIDEYIYSFVTNASPYMGMCRSSHTHFPKHTEIIHKSWSSAFADTLRKVDYLSCLDDIVLSRFKEYIANSKDSSMEKDTDSVQEISMQSIFRYLAQLDIKIDSYNEKLNQDSVMDLKDLNKETFKKNVQDNTIQGNNTLGDDEGR